jgi:lipid A 4'-phosphatase
MHYLKQRRIQIILGCFVASSLVLSAFPQVDIYISRLFFDGSFYLARRWWTTFMHESMSYALCLSLSSVVGLYAWNKPAKRSLCEVDGKKVVYLFLVLIVGAGLTVNVLLKDNFGRARPRDVVEFGGSRHYTPPFVISGECGTNCSFSSGEAAGGFFPLVLLMALSRRRALLAAAAGFGILVSFCRIASGAHFFSDTVVSFFVMLSVADVLSYCLAISSTPALATSERPAPPLPA